MSSAGEGRRGFGAWWAWLVVFLGILYFFVPLIAAAEFSLRACAPPNQPCSTPDFSAYANTFADSQFFSTLTFSFVVGLTTIAVSLLIIVPTAYWVRLRMPRLRPVVEFITLLPFVIPPVVLVFGLIRIYSRPPLLITATNLGSVGLLVAAYVVLSFPYMYRAVDAGLAAMDVRVLTEAAQSMGAGWRKILWSVIFPNLRTAALSGAFLTLAIVVGEFTIGNYMAPYGFGPYLSLLGRDKIFEPAAVSLISFGLTWLAMAVIALVGRGPRGTRVQVAGAR
ncbi:MAG TPA: ABC transporter permease subunit [Candidatus Binatia bacterium]|nr:ABC transporter permease subunit [Candidatus Binatia bacterium]